MLILGFIDIQDLNDQHGQKKGRPLRSCLLSKKMNGHYYLCIKNSMHPNCITYKILDLAEVHTKCINEGKLGMRFKQPKHLVLLQADDKKMLHLFIRQIQDISNGKEVSIGARLMPKIVPPKKDNVNLYNPMNIEFSAVGYFDNRILNMRNLKKLVLDNCVLSTIPEQLGNLPITYLSLSGASLATTQYDQDTQWNWMSKNTIGNTLKTLKMDSNNLKALPFEMLYLKNLHTLSINKNHLTYLPLYMGEIQKLTYLFVNNNSLRYFPNSLISRRFEQLDISNNMFIQCDMLELDHIHSYKQSHNIKVVERPIVKKLSHLAFCSLVENRVKFKRQDIPRTLWYYFNVIGRCSQCHKFTLPDYSVLKHTVGFPITCNLIRNNSTNNLSWQSLECSNKCN